MEETLATCKAVNVAYCTNAANDTSQPLPEVERIVHSIASREAGKKRKRPARKGSDTGRRPLLEDVDPWPEAVDGSELLAGIVELITRYIVLSTDSAVAIALWVVYAHAHLESFVSPILCVSSPVKRCGKTTLIDLIAGVVPRPLKQANATKASIFRIIESKYPTLILDEADTWLLHDEEMKGLLNSGWLYGFATVIRCNSDTHAPQEFSTWCPKVIALIGQLPDTLEDRAIIVEMRRKGRLEQVQRVRFSLLEKDVDELCRKASRWVSDNLDALRNSDPNVPDVLDDRAADNWRPLIAVADLAGGDWPRRARVAAVGSARGRDPDEGDIKIQLLQDLRSIFGDCERLSTTDILAALTKMEDHPWASWQNGRELTANQLAGLLRAFRIKPNKWRDCRGYLRSDFEDAWSRYVPVPDLVTSPQVSQVPHSELCGIEKVALVTAVAANGKHSVSGVAKDREAEQ